MRALLPVSTAVLVMGCTLLLEALPERIDCDDAYPTVCIASPPPDLNYEDLEVSNFETLEPDPHQLDADGVGCEL